MILVSHVFLKVPPIQSKSASDRTQTLMQVKLDSSWIQRALTLSKVSFQDSLRPTRASFRWLAAIWASRTLILPTLSWYCAQLPCWRLELDVSSANKTLRITAKLEMKKQQILRTTDYIHTIRIWESSLTEHFTQAMWLDMYDFLQHSSFISLSSCQSCHLLYS
jgi:hypothetical protein